MMTASNMHHIVLVYGRDCTAWVAETIHFTGVLRQVGVHTYLLSVGTKDCTRLSRCTVWAVATSMVIDGVPARSTLR